jgi:hypothetical protein
MQERRSSALPAILSFYVTSRETLELFPGMFLLMLEMTDAGENHGNIEFICRRDNVGITNGASGLNHRADAVFGCCYKAIREREVRVGSQCATLQGERRLHGAPFNRIHAACLTGSDSKHARGI